MENLASAGRKSFINLIEAVAVRSELSVFGLGLSVGDDLLAPSLATVTTLGPSVGDDINAPSMAAVTTLGPSVGDDINAPSMTAVTTLGPSVGDDQTTSDLRLKHDVRCVGATVFGLPLYHFKYIGEPETYEGVMAHQVLQVMPDAVSLGADGYHRVNYGMLGTSMRQVS